MKINFSPHFFKTNVQDYSKLISHTPPTSSDKNHFDSNFDTIDISKDSVQSPNFVDPVQSEEGDKIKVELLHSKLKRGEELSSSELNFLKKTSPGLYEKAVEINRERKEYRQQLESCKTKQDVEKIKNLKMNRFAKEIKAINNAPLSQSEKEEKLEMVKMRQAAIENEHKQFIKTNHYKSLKETDEDSNKVEHPKKTHTSSRADDSKEVDDFKKADAIKESDKESILNQVK
ncbi:MAG: hypothetical protein EOM05_03620 [Clostridia bacterium]|nr:hypothetical protein [Clostridia bacterium]